MDKAQIQATLENIDVWLLVFGILVVIGVGGESIFGIRHWWNSRKLQAIQEAEESAREETIAGLNRDAAQLRKEAEDERTARLALEKQVIPRRLSGDQIKALSEQVDAVSKHGNITIISAMLDGESSDLADDFNAAFKKAGWNTQRWPMRATTGRTIELGTAGEVAQDAAYVLSKLRGAITSTGFPCVATTFRSDDQSVPSGFKNGHLYLAVNHKPEVVLPANQKAK